MAAFSDLAMQKIVDNPTPLVGSNVIFTLNASNLGPDEDLNAFGIDLLPSGYSLVSAIPSVGTYIGNIWTIGSMQPAALESLIITATVLPTGVYNNTAVISGDNIDPNLLNNTSTANVNPIAPPTPPSKKRKSGGYPDYINLKESQFEGVPPLSVLYYGQTYVRGGRNPQTDGVVTYYMNKK